VAILANNVDEGNTGDISVIRRGGEKRMEGRRHALKISKTTALPSTLWPKNFPMPLTHP
jgi:hypothetical protein